MRLLRVYRGGSLDFQRFYSFHLFAFLGCDSLQSLGLGFCYYDNATDTTASAAVLVYDALLPQHEGMLIGHVH
jgi:hypothetical protein